MPLAGIELAYIVKEIETETQGYYVSNIWGINRNSLLFKLHHPKKPDIMLMVSTTGMWITKKKIDSIEPNKLLRRLRSDLLRSKIEKIEQIGTERIAYLTFSNFENRFVLIIEFFGEGNLLLCNYNKKILALLHSIDVKHRQLRVGVEYAPPPTDGDDPIDKSATKKLTDRLFWMRIAFSIIGGVVATYVFDDIADVEEKRWTSIGFMIMLFIATAIIAKSWRIKIANKKKYVTTGIGSFVFLYLFFWIMSYTLIHAGDTGGIVPFT